MSFAFIFWKKGVSHLFPGRFLKKVTDTSEGVKMSFALIFWKKGVSHLFPGRFLEKVTDTSAVPPKTKGPTKNLLTQRLKEL